MSSERLVSYMNRFLRLKAATSALSRIAITAHRDHRVVYAAKADSSRGRKHEMGLVWTIIAAAISYVAISIILPRLAFFVVMPIMTIGVSIRPLRIPMWFIARYGVFILEAALLLWLTRLAGQYFNLWTTALLAVNALLLLQILITHYQFDLMLFRSQSGIWAQDDASASR